MADNLENEEEGKEAAPPKKSGKKLWLIIAGAVLLLPLIGVPSYMFLFKKTSIDTELLDGNAIEGEEHGVIEGHDDEEEIYDEGEQALGAIFPMETFVVNLSGGNKYMRCQVQLEFAGREVPQRYYVRSVPIRDALLALFSSRTAEELASSEGKETLKDEIKEKINEILKREEVVKVYFTQFVVQ